MEPVFMRWHLEVGVAPSIFPGEAADSPGFSPVPAYLYENSFHMALYLKNYGTEAEFAASEGDPAADRSFDRAGVIYSGGQEYSVTRMTRQSFDGEDGVIYVDYEGDMVPRDGGGMVLRLSSWDGVPDVGPWAFTYEGSDSQSRPGWTDFSGVTLHRIEWSGPDVDYQGITLKPFTLEIGGDALELYHVSSVPDRPGTSLEFLEMGFEVWNVLYMDQQRGPMMAGDVGILFVVPPSEAGPTVTSVVPGVAYVQSTGRVAYNRLSAWMGASGGVNYWDDSDGGFWDPAGRRVVMPSLNPSCEVLAEFISGIAEAGRSTGGSLCIGLASQETRQVSSNVPIYASGYGTSTPLTAGTETVWVLENGGYPIYVKSLSEIGPVGSDPCTWLASVLVNETGDSKYDYVPGSGFGPEFANKSLAVSVDWVENPK